MLTILSLRFLAIELPNYAVPDSSKLVDFDNNFREASEGNPLHISSKSSKSSSKLQQFSYKNFSFVLIQTSFASIKSNFHLKLNEIRQDPLSTRSNFAAFLLGLSSFFHAFPTFPHSSNIPSFTLPAQPIFLSSQPIIFSTTSAKHHNKAPPPQKHLESFACLRRIKTSTLDLTSILRCCVTRKPNLIIIFPNSHSVNGWKVSFDGANRSRIIECHTNDAQKCFIYLVLFLPPIDGGRKKFIRFGELTFY
jgi:hypothetical protein